MPEENFWTLWCKGRLTESDTLTIRTNQCLPPSSPHIFLRAGCLSCRPTNSVEALKAGTWSSAQTISDVFTKVISSLNTSAFSKLGFLMMMMSCINSLTYLLTLLTYRTSVWCAGSSGTSTILPRRQSTSQVDISHECWPECVQTARRSDANTPATNHNWLQFTDQSQTDWAKFQLPIWHTNRSFHRSSSHPVI